MRKPPPPIDAEKVREFLTGMFGQDLHAMRVLSMANATLGVVHAAALSVHAIGLGLARAEGLESKHAIKQVDRLLSNTGIDVWALFEQWVPFLLGGRTEAVVALDWTEFDADNQSTIAIHLITSHGRATPLVWKTVVKSELKGWRNDHEDAVIARLLEVVPRGLKVTLLADRGFGDQKLFALLKRWECDFVIRFREGIAVTDEAGETRTAKEWVPASGRPLLLRNASVTRDQMPLPAVVCVKAKGMKDAWCLAASSPTATGAELVKLYSRRFTIEESFRDSKNPRFGFGLSQARVSAPARRDRLFLINALAVSLLTLLGAAGESLGFERLMKANTVKTRTYSLLRQGCHYYDCIPAMKPEKLAPLIDKFAELVRAQSLFRGVFGLL
jgi:hypothetical protein